MIEKAIPNNDPESGMDWDDFVGTYMELTADEEDASAQNDELEDLYSIYLNRINLNDLDSVRLSELPFLDEADRIMITAYVRRNAPVLSTG